MGKHSSSVCFYKGHFYVAYYETPQSEGWQQEVVVLKNPFSSEPTVTCRLQGGYGNPVVFVHNDLLLLACSRFRDEVRNIEDCRVLWAHADLLLYSLGDKARLLDKYPYMSPRCAPISLPCVDNAKAFETLLPTYDEMAKVSALMRLLPVTRETIGAEGLKINRGLIFNHPTIPMIQPSAICADDTWTIYGRNFGYPYKPGCPPITPVIGYKIISHKLVHGINENIPNHNESVLLFQNVEDKNEPYVVFNDGPGRTNLTIGPVDPAAGRSKIVLNAIAGHPYTKYGHGSYPNYCNSKDGLVVCCTVYDDKSGTGLTNQYIRLARMSSESGQLNIVEVRDLTVKY